MKKNIFLKRTDYVGVRPGKNTFHKKSYVAGHL